MSGGKGQPGKLCEIKDVHGSGQIMYTLQIEETLKGRDDKKILELGVEFMKGVN